MSNYRIVIHGVRSGYSTEQVAKQLASYSKKQGEKLRSLLSNKRPLLAKRTPDMQPALRYKQFLEKMGCECRIEAEISQQPPASADKDAVASLTDFTASHNGNAPPAREFTYRKASLGTRLRRLVGLFRLKGLILVSAVGLLFYYYVW